MTTVADQRTGNETGAHAQYRAAHPTLPIVRGKAFEALWLYKLSGSLLPPDCMHAWGTDSSGDSTITLGLADLTLQ